MSGQRRIRVLVVDDSAVARDLLERGLSLDPEIEVVGKASDVYAARDKIVFLKPDVMTLDVEMPRMDGIEFLKRLIPQYPIPTVVVSAVTADGSRRALEALDAGAVEVVGKPSANDGAGLREMLADLAEKVKAAASADLSKLSAKAPAAAQPRRRSKSQPERVGKVVAIGASTGGTAALHRVIESLPADFPPVLVVQHMPPVFTRMFAESLDRSSALRVVEAADGDPLVRGCVAVAPGDKHLTVVRKDRGYAVYLGDGPKVSGHRPSVDVLFGSMADAVGAGGIGVLLTGMGRDGADGLAAMRRAGARCLAQDEASSVVWGMPREAWMAGAAERLVPLGEIAREIAALAAGEDNA
jgi:two-component system chemotaxis response regulator CheB